ncbi:cell division protein ZipA-like [Hibiscus syriacus]|uniref:cell division protein ZipA-like n=1 Tax=Hibiscus syriacus TaxID=106335 RepID=UPI0019240A58|nr:cell division protein ZipA-like [Hibiscus syriacus]
MEDQHKRWAKFKENVQQGNGSIAEPLNRWKKKVPKEPFEDFIKSKEGITKKKVPELMNFDDNSPHESQGNTDEFLSSSSFYISESTQEISPDFFADEDFTPSPTHPEQTPVQSPVRQETPVPKTTQIQTPVPAQPTLAEDQQTPARALSTKRSIKRMAGRVLQPPPR